MSKPIVAVIGRPNVGKSTFFNVLAGERISIVDDTPGVTRDRVYAESDWRGRRFSIVDTGGIEPNTNDSILRQMRDQAYIAIETADVIVFLVDLKTGLTADDQDIAALLRKSGKPVVLTVNKADHPGQLPAEAYEFYNLGLGEIYTVSAAHRLGFGELLDAVYSYFPPEDDDHESDERIRIAVIGRPNAGKSSLINRMLGEDRTLVSDQPGTTRDAIDSDLDNQYGRYTLIDTAGLRKKSRIEDSVEKYSMIRSLAAVDRSSVCLIMIDAEKGVTEQDTKVAGYAHNSGKASILVVNKWDLIEKETGTLERFSRDVKEKFSFMLYAPVLFVSAKTGQRINGLYQLINEVHEQSRRRLTTGLLNDVINDAVAMVPTPQDKGRHLRIYYATQVGTSPPQIALFINDSDLMHFSYERYLENQLRKSFGFKGNPVWFLLRPKNKD